MTRIVAGLAGGRRLRTLPGEGTRPTSDRVREALFSTLEAATGGLDGSRVLDLYAGSGALGLEALSRGAAHARLVERDRRAAAVVRANVATLGLPGAQVVTADVGAHLAGTPPQAPYDVVLLDPPYALDTVTVDAVLSQLAGGWLTTDALVVVERNRRTPAPTWPEGLGDLRRRDYGETTLWYGRPAP